MKTKTRILIFQIVLMSILLMHMSSCNKDDESLPVLTTDGTWCIIATNAHCSGYIISEGGTRVQISGICWSTGQTPTIFEHRVVNSFGYDIQCTLSGLNPSTTYYVRAFARNKNGIGYGNEISFTTPKEYIFFNPELTYGSLTDIDNNIYKTITIGTQTWMAENLMVTHYRNGDPITNVSNYSDWKTLLSGAYCCYNNDTIFTLTYGNLYNWHAVNDSRNIAPIGWHVPSVTDWTILGTYMEEQMFTRWDLMETCGHHWSYDFGYGGAPTNTTGFTVLPAGSRNSYDDFIGLSQEAVIWSSTEDNSSNAWTWGEISIEKSYGCSVRCIKDN